MWLIQIARLNLLWHPPHGDQIGIANLATEGALGNGPIKDEHVDLVFACKYEIFMPLLKFQNSFKLFTCLNWLPFSLECALIQWDQPGMLLLAAGRYSKQGRGGFFG